MAALSNEGTETGYVLQKKLYSELIMTGAYATWKRKH